ncbi:MAG: isoprenylcysteine carboxylmethyltransferase family protein [Acidobacteriia bacterium]|jgi:protein-S-isoprenylcysteine O-methyltransferase Ste14|nr:isoprenylcysteine carboxylmethyltransferase family protein [Terriglobia bacterium]
MSEKEVFRVLVEFPWIIFVIYWILGAIKTRATRQQESFASRYLVVLLEIVGYGLIFSHSARVGFLGNRFMHRTRESAAVGAALTWLGIGLAIWARYHLAEYWSARVTIKEDHQLIRTGPYAHLRHPIYTGLILATIGSAVVIDEWRCVFGVCLVLTGYCLKARKEEAMLRQQFGEAFREHQKHTGFLIPRFR